MNAVISNYGLLATVVPLHELIAEYRYPPHRGGNTKYLVSPVNEMQGKGPEKPLLQTKEAFMGQKNINRLVWNNGFTNDRQAPSNREAYPKTCDKCRKKIWMTPDGAGWKALNQDGSKHQCSKAKKVGKEPKYFEKDCKFCGEKIVMMLLKKKKWVAFDQSRAKHRCRGLKIG